MLLRTRWTRRALFGALFGRGSELRRHFPACTLINFPARSWTHLTLIICTPKNFCSCAPGIGWLTSFSREGYFGYRRCVFLSVRAIAEEIDTGTEVLFPNARILRSRSTKRCLWYGRRSK